MTIITFYHKKTAERKVKMWLISGTVPAQRSCSPKLTHIAASDGQEPAETVAAPVLAISAYCCKQPATAK